METVNYACSCLFSINLTSKHNLNKMTRSEQKLTTKQTSGDVTKYFKNNLKKQLKKQNNGHLKLSEQGYN